MQHHLHTFTTSLNDKKGNRIGDITVEVAMKFTKDLALQSWDISEVIPVPPLSNYTLCTWCYEVGSLDDYLNDAIESAAEGVREILQAEQEAAEADRQAMEETYRSLEKQFIV